MTMPGQTQPFLYPGMYNPGQFAFGNNAELSNLISMMAMPILGQMAGPGNFMPHMMPGQALFDQFTMRNYQQQTQAATYNLAGAQNADGTNLMLGLRSIFTPSAPSDLNRSQASNIAGLLDNPMVKSIIGMAIGPDNYEMMRHGSKGDIQNLGASVNKFGYFRRDPSGGGRMDAQSLEDLTTGMFSHLYEPQGDLDKLSEEARAGDERSMKRLREASKTLDDHVVVSDTDVQKRLQNKGDTEVGRLYEKYVQGGTATDAATQAKELVKFDRAIKESGVLGGTETTVGRMRDRAERMPVDEMHGFMAGQVGQLAENLAQRGVLPPSIGGLSAKERVGAVAETKLDDATLDRLAQTLARRDLESGDSDNAVKYREAVAAGDEAAKKRILGETAESHAAGLRSKKEEAEKFARGESTKSAEEILQGPGGEALAGNVDASRASSKIKGYTDALSAVRDIFGDNGNPNAPMPALMAMLDHLTQGGMGNMDPKRAASTLRSMQTLARETGTGMQQLAQMSAVAGNLGQQLGIAPSITMQNVAASMGITKSAMDTGAFSSGTFGTKNKEEFQNKTIQMLQEGDASGNAKSMAALARIYEMDPDKFKGTELEAAMAAYNDPNSDGTYTFTDPETGETVTRNLYEDIGKGRQFAAQDLLTDSGGSVDDFHASLHDPLTQQFARAGAGYMTQKHERIQTLAAYTTDSTVRARMAGTETLSNMDDSEVMAASEVITGMMLDSADMGPKEQAAFMKNNMEEKLTAHFKSQGKDEATAKKMAQEMTQKMTGDASALNRMIANTGTVANDLYGENLAEMSQRYGHNRDVYGMLETGNAAARAEAEKRMIGYETTVGQRASDYLLDIGKKGEKFNLGNFMKAMAPVIGDDEVLRQYAGEMGAGMATAASERDKYQVTKKHVESLSERAKKEGPGGAAEQELRRLGNVSDDTKIITTKEIDAAREAKIDKLSGKDLDKAFMDATGRKSAAGVTDEQKKEALRKSESYKGQFAQQYKDEVRSRKDGKYLTEEELQSRAMGSLGKALTKDVEGDLADIESVQRAFEQGQSKDALQGGVDAMFRMKGLQGAFKGMSAADKKSLEQAIMTEGDSKAAILKSMGLSEEEYEKGLQSKEKSDKQKAAEIAIGLDSAHKYDMDKMAKDAAQKVEKAEIDATTVVIKADKVEGVGGAAAGAAVQAPGAALPSDMAGVDAELAAIEERNKDNWWDYDAPDKERRAELMKKKEELAQKEMDEKTRPKDASETKPDKPAEAPAKPPEDATKTPPGADGQLPPGSDVSQTEAAQRGADAAASVNAQQAAKEAIPDATAATGTAGTTSANVNPAAVSSPQQNPAPTTTAAGGSGGAGGGGPITVTGSININNLREGVLELVNQHAIHPPGNGSPIVPDPAANHVGGGATASS